MRGFLRYSLPLKDIFDILRGLKKAFQLSTCTKKKVTSSISGTYVNLGNRIVKSIPLRYDMFTTRRPLKRLTSAAHVSLNSQPVVFTGIQGCATLSHNRPN